LLMHKQAPVILEKQVGYVTDTFKKLSEEVTVEKLYELINELNETQKEIRFSYQPTVFLEVMTVKLSTSSLASSKTSELSTSEIGASNEDNSYLLEKINQLELEVHSLKEKGIQVSRQEATQSNAPKKAKASTYRIPTEQVYQVLEKAKKDQLIAVKGAWQELLQFLSVTQRAMIKASEPVAASEDSLVIAFDYEILCQKASQDEELAIAMRHGFERLLRYSPNFISVPKEQWTELRQSFISQMDTSSTPGEEKQVQSDPVVDEAKELFGSFVNIIED
ncbi:MAG: DNA polymerase III subunit gamma/tau, partial [Vagococcus fluvialis]